MPRRKFDFYETPPHYLKALEHLALPIAETDHVLDPCVGEGAISEWLDDVYGPVVTTNDIDKRRLAHYKLDATVHDFGRFDWIIYNPPFNEILGFWTNLIDQGQNMISLARISANEPTRDRGPWLGLNPPKFIQFLPRYSFRLNDKGERQTDNVTCCWMGWGPDVPKGIFYSLEKEQK